MTDVELKIIQDLHDFILFHCLHRQP